MTPRMEQLKRQRALLHEHLRWLESEIAAETSAVLTVRPAAAAPAPSIAPQPTTAPDHADLATASAPNAPAAEVPEADVRGIHSEVRSGCLLYFAIAFVALAAVVGFIYWRY